jgi:hypothetical protein
MTLKIMRWTVAKRARMEMSNRMGSPFFAGLQMDFLPGIFSAAYFAFRLQREPADAVPQLLRTGQAVQRFWLTATQLGLAMQPCQAALAFAHYGAANQAFTVSQAERGKAAKLARRVEKDLSGLQSLIFLGRIGVPAKAGPDSRSLRRPLAELVRDGA